MGIKSYVCFSLVLIPLMAYFSMRYIYSPITGIVETNSKYGEAKIVYSEPYGIPYITGATNEAIYYAQGFAHASDRLYELQLKRAMASGRVSEMFGSGGLIFDKFFRSLQFMSVIEEDYKHLNATYKNYLEAYAAGINEYVRVGVMPIEFKLMNVKFEEWTYSKTAEGNQ